MSKPICASYLVAAVMLLWAMSAPAAPQYGVNKNKLTHPEKITEPFVQGQEFVKVTVNLTQPWDILANTNWRSAKSLSVLRQEIHGRQQRVLETLSADEFLLRHRYENLTSFSAEVTLAGLQKLSSDPRVESIEPVFLLEPHVAQGIDLMNALATRSTYNGQGIAIAICDTGIDYNHPVLGGGGFPNAKVLGGYDFGDNDSDPIPNGQAHGTCCAGIAAGDIAAVGDYIGGVAYGAKLYALKISEGTTGSASSDDMAAAWDWCITHQNDDPDNPIMIISTSFGGGRYSSLCDSAMFSMTTAANNAVAAGITLLVSSGNDGYCDSIGWPACISSVISVGAVYDASFGTYLPCISADSCAPKTSTTGCATGYYATDITVADKVTSYSNTAAFLTILAPSNQAYTTAIGGYTSSFGGTSAACPYAAGVVAALQSAAKATVGDYLTPGEVRDLLTSTGDYITDDKVAITKPRVNLGNAMGIFSATPPVAQNVAAATQFDTPVTVILDATDEGLPNPLSYIITSLPSHGWLADAQTPASPIATVPYVLRGNQLIYTPRPGCEHPVSFSYIANDGGTAPEGGDSNEAIVNVSFENSVTLYSATMDTDPNWACDGNWAWGVPAGSGGARGNADPSSGYTGSNVVGYNLSGDYAKNMSATEWTTISAIDCTGAANVTLDFYRWLNVDSYDKDQAVVEVSSDGLNWTRVWQNDSKVTDNSWTLQSLDISSVADNQPTVHIRWGMGPTNNNQNYSGWNIDDVSVTGELQPSPPIAGDFEPDCDVDIDDLMLLVDHWLDTCGDCNGTDLIEDGIINLSDLAALAQNWLPLQDDYIRIFHWPFDTDASEVSHGYDGMLMNGAVIDIADPAVGPGAVMLDGVDDHVEISDASILNPNANNWSVALWLRSDIPSQGTQFISKRADVTPYVQHSIGLSSGDSYTWPAGGKLTFLFREDTGVEKGGYTTSDVDLSNWTHVCVVLDREADTVYVYINGVSVTVTLDHNGVLPTINNNDPLYIGGNPNVTSFFRGLIDDVRIYNRALSQAEIEAIAQ